MHLASLNSSLNRTSLMAKIFNNQFKAFNCKYKIRHGMNWMQGCSGWIGWNLCNGLVVSYCLFWQKGTSISYLYFFHPCNPAQGAHKIPPTSMTPNCYVDLRPSASMLSLSLSLSPSSWSSLRFLNSWLPDLETVDYKFHRDHYTPSEGE